MLSDVIVDDSRLDLIRYINPDPDPIGHWAYNWSHYMAPTNESSPNYNATISSCYQSGCMIMFLFHGTQVAAYGAEPVGTASWSSYSINGLNNETHVTETEAATRVLLYRSEEMPYGEYTLEIYVGHASDDSPYTLDWIEYNTTSSESSSDPPSTASSSISAISPVSHSTSTSTTIPTDTPPNSVHGGSAHSVGAIAAGVVGGSVIFIFAAALTVWLARRYLRARTPVHLDDGRSDEHQDLIDSSHYPADPAPAYTPFASAQPSSPSPDVESDMAEAQISLVSAPLPPDSSEDRQVPYGPHGVISRNEKATYLALAGTTPASSSDHHEDGVS